MPIQFYFCIVQQLSYRLHALIPRINYLLMISFIFSFAAVLN